MNKEDYFYQFDYSLLSNLSLRDEEMRYTQNVIAKIYAVNDNESERFVVGNATANIVLIDFNREFTLYDVLDSYSQEMAPIADVFVDTKRPDIVKDSLLNKLNSYYPARIIYLEHIDIQPDFRGIDLGKKLTIDLLMQFMGENDIAIMKPMPLQLSKSISEKEKKEKGYDIFTKDEKKAYKDLKKYYKTFGFVNVNGVKDYMLATRETIDGIVNEYLYKRD
jgi:hypothetical protein